MVTTPKGHRQRISTVLAHLGGKFAIDRIFIVIAEREDTAVGAYSEHTHNHTQ